MNSPHIAALCILLSLLSVSCSSSRVVKGDGNIAARLTFLFQSNRLGALDPCQCASTPYGGMGREANLVRSFRESQAAVFYVDGGNSLLPQFMTFEPSYYEERARVMVEAFNLLALDVFAPGPMDWGMGKDFLLELVKNSNFKTVSTNVVGEDGKALFPTVQTLERGGLRWGFIAVSPEGQLAPGVWARSPAKALNQLAYRLSSQVDQLVLLSHLSAAENREILKKYPQIHVIFANDPSQIPEQPEWIDGRLLVDIGQLGFYVGRLSFQYKFPFRGFYSPLGAEISRTEREYYRRQLSSVTTREEKIGVQAKLIALEKGHPTDQVTGTTTYFYELTALDGETFGQVNDITKLLDTNLMIQAARYQGISPPDVSSSHRRKASAREPAKVSAKAKKPKVGKKEDARAVEKPTKEPEAKPKKDSSGIYEYSPDEDDLGAAEDELDPES